ncbi:MAG: hypothetical protein ACJ8AW_16210 [Rhodopila sp.]
MNPSFVVPLAFALGAATGAAGLYLLRPDPAAAQANPTARFVPALMTASEGDKGSVAWFMATDGRVRACLHAQGPSGPTINCLPVSFAP